MKDSFFEAPQMIILKFNVNFYGFNFEKENRTSVQSYNTFLTRLKAVLIIELQFLVSLLLMLGVSFFGGL